MPVTEPAPRPAQGRRHDPGRRDRIIDACIDVIAEDGVDGTSHRRVAAAADVPLGSMTYHFDGRDDLLHAAFERYSHEVSDRFVARLDQVPAGDREAGVRAVVAIVTQDVFPSRRDLVLTHELYTLAARDPAFRSLTNAWMRRSRAALERCFDPATARVLDALIEGITIHRALDTEAPDDSDVDLAVRRLAGL
ncbi:TetR/AcrR family transcriptional regulator [Cellulomonas triticagri]|uniref:TetR family transcriptional regulator n=1 Tax=Cellulomonas triticagri TaxID=2483352 RepID=A0A3M2IUU4_9CELL|nr:TetR family transcriptional regulator [Cellulomonas triticagri]RMI04889.1 TetR family transcriptional regulator [Cellulomonas triticagri]